MPARLSILLLAGLAACTGTTKPPVVTDTSPEPSESLCEANSFGAELAWDAVGPYGTVRRSIAEDVELTMADGSTWSLAENWSGCEHYLFVPDDILRAEGDDRSFWTRDLDDLVAGSPRNVHYFFVSVNRDADAAAASYTDMVERVDEVLGDLEPEDAEWWSSHLHVVGTRAQDIGGWFEGVYLRGVGQGGFAIDRNQQIRGFGSFADVTRYDPSASGWPFDNNLAYVAHEARYLEMEAARAARLAPIDATVVPLWTGEVIEQFAEMEIDLPAAADMATFDTFEIEVDMRCPDPDEIEYGNCGAWDYLAHLYVQEEDESWTELGRFITTYHREAHWVLDATPMMVHLLDGGTRKFKWEWAPEWNTQPTETRLNLRFSDQGKGIRPRTATKVATGGSFGSTYNDGRVPVDVDVSSAAKVELWAITTGHGAGTYQCAEFCAHQHEFTVGTSVYLQEFADVGNDEGCITQIEDQMTPNQAGTWWYGRGGWCPGQLVEPYAVDVTADVSGGTATVGYRGLYGDETPEDGSGDIVLNAWIVTYE